MVTFAKEIASSLGKEKNNKAINNWVKEFHPQSLFLIVYKF